MFNCFQFWDGKFENYGPYELKYSMFTSFQFYNGSFWKFWTLNYNKEAGFFGHENTLNLQP